MLRTCERVCARSLATRGFPDRGPRSRAIEFSTTYPPDADGLRGSAGQVGLARTGEDTQHHALVTPDELRVQGLECDASTREFKVDTDPVGVGLLRPGNSSV